MESMQWRPRAVGGDVVSSLETAKLNDRQKVAVLLEAAATLAVLRHQGLDLVGDWQTAGVDRAGNLCGLQAIRGSTGWAVQSQLRRLSQRMFGHCPVVGRGEARAAVRRLAERWADDLTPVEPTQIVSSILRDAPFLWQPQFATARQALVPEPTGPDGSRWIAAPGPAQRRFLASSSDHQSLTDLVMSSCAQRLWEGSYADRDPWEALERGRWYEAARSWEESPPKDSKGRLGWASSLTQLGRFESALEVLRGGRSRQARWLRATCYFFLGRLPACRKVLQGLWKERLEGRQLVEIAELAVRLEANRGDLEAAAVWVERALEETTGVLRLRALVLAAEACWDRKDLSGMERRLDEAQELESVAEHAWRWYVVCALLAMARHDGESVVTNIGRALRLQRRRLPRVAAAGLFNDLAVGRWQMGDLAGAERACGHASRLLARCEGPRRQLLSQRNLAELRLRRGRLEGVREILENALVRNRQDGNVRSAVEDATLWVRWELVHGRATAALRICDETLGELEASGNRVGSEGLSVLAARALGWLGRPEEAAARLEGNETAVAELEPEERPAVWALAGDREQALSVTPEGGVGELWRAALIGTHPTRGAGTALDALESYRAGRLVWDLELVSPGTVEVQRRRQAVRDLRRVGADTLASRLEARSMGPWESLATFLAEAEVSEGAVARLFAETGCIPARLAQLDGVSERLLVEGPHAATELVAPMPDGVLRLEMESIDPLARALFRAVWRRLRGDRGQSREAVDDSPERTPSIPGLVGRSPALTRVLAPLPRLAQAAMPILILGESGTGKEVVAQQIHELSPRAGAAFLPFNCAAVSEQLILSDLFGHVKGAFTGADRNRMGIFESARGGTVFLDEIGDLPPAAQGMLLRVLQEKEIRRVGETLPRRVDVRVVAATHHGLLEMVEAGRFRRDLYYRLRVAELVLPPLRDRGRDVLLLARHFLRGWSHTAGLTREAAGQLAGYDWPGNVRELRNVLEVAVALAGPGTAIDRDHLQLEVAPATPREEADSSDYQKSVLAFRRDLIETALGETEGNQAAAARRLGLTRQALTYNIRTLGIIVPKRRSGAS